MKLLRVLAGVLVLMGCLASPLFVPTALASGELTGDTKLACEAIICLSSGTRPSACAASLSRYFNITGKNAARDRTNFLNLCPSSSSPQMPSLISAIVGSAGQCDVQNLNSRRIPVTVYDQDGSGREVMVVDSSMPGGCAAYFGHPYVAYSRPVYVGEPLKGGYWQ